jgi:hypothetical protein
MLLKSKKISVALKNYCLRFYKFSVCCCRFECCFICLCYILEPKNIRNELSIPICFQGVSLSLTLVRHLHLLIAVLNGLGSFLKRIWINSIGNAIGLLFSIVLILEYRTISIISDCCISSLIVLSASIL